MVEGVARATLTNVDTFIDWVIDAPGLRPARDFRYGDDSDSEQKLYFQYVTMHISSASIN